MVGTGIYEVHDQGELSFAVDSVTMCPTGSPITCVPQDHNVTRTQNRDGAIFWGNHCKFSLLNKQKVLGSVLLNTLTSEKSGFFFLKWVELDEVLGELWQRQPPPPYTFIKGNE